LFRHTPPAAAAFGVTSPGGLVVVVVLDLEDVGAAVGVTITTLVTVEGPSLPLPVAVLTTLLDVRVDELDDEARRLLLLDWLDDVTREDEEVEEETGVLVGLEVVLVVVDDDDVLVETGVEVGLAPPPVLMSVGVTVVPTVVNDVTTTTEGILLEPEPPPTTFSAFTQTREPMATVPVAARTLGALVVKGKPTAAPVPSSLLNGVQVTALASVPLDAPVR